MHVSNVLFAILQIKPCILWLNYITDKSKVPVDFIWIRSYEVAKIYESKIFQGNRNNVSSDKKMFYIHDNTLSIFLFKNFTSNIS